MRAFYNRVALTVLGAAALAVVGMTAWRAFLDRAGGAYAHAPEDAAWVLSDTAERLVERAFAGLSESGVDDYGVAIFSRGQLGPPAIDNDSFYRGRDAGEGAPLAWIAARLRMNAAGVHEPQRADAEYVSRLLRQLRAMPAAYRVHALARDRRYHADARRDTVATHVFVANDYVYWLSEQAPEAVVPVVSIHPYRTDALEALERWAGRGVGAVSWRPASQNIDLQDSRAHAFYRALAGHDMALHVRVGAAEARHEDATDWVDPLALRHALEAGVTVIASVRAGKDGATTTTRLLDLLRSAAADERLRIDLAGLLASHALDDVLAPLLQHPQFYDNLRYASGYPMPAVNAHIDLDLLADRGFIAPDQVAPLREIYHVNPLMFVFVTLRSVRLPHTQLRLPDSVFAAP